MAITPRVLIAAVLARHVAVAPVIAQTTVQATDSASMSALAKKLKAGSRVEITTAAEVLSGRFKSRTETAFIIDVADAAADRVVRFDSVKSLTYSEQPPKLSRGAKIAIGVAAAVGAFLLVAWYHWEKCGLFGCK